MVDLSEITPKAIQESVTALERLYDLLKKVYVDGWNGISVLKNSKNDANEREAVDHLVNNLRKLHAFRLAGITQIEQMLEGNTLSLFTYRLSQLNDSFSDISDNSPNIVSLSASHCWSSFAELNGPNSTLFSDLLGRYYSEIISLTLIPVFESEEFTNLDKTIKTQPDKIREIIALERERLMTIEKIANFLSKLQVKR